MARDGEDTSGAGLGGAAREVCAGAVEAVSLRLELLGLELQQEKRRLFATVFLAMSASLAGFMALLFANLTLVVSFWDHRLTVIAGLAVGYLLLALVCIWIVRRRLAGNRMPFPETTNELRKDAETLGMRR